MPSNTVGLCKAFIELMKNLCANNKREKKHNNNAIVEKKKFLANR